jgi:hypothetical protein
MFLIMIDKEPQVEGDYGLPFRRPKKTGVQVLPSVIVDWYGPGRVLISNTKKLITIL